MGYSSPIQRGIIPPSIRKRARCSVTPALDIFARAKGDFHLLLTDVVLPDQSGLDLIRKLHLIKPGLPVLISSGYSNHRTQWPVIAEKGYRLIEKPYTAAGLLAAVKEAIINPVGA